jgi:hypothetical protein
MRERRLARIFEASDRMKREPRRPNQPLKDFPIYTVPEAAAYLAMPARTLRYWVSDRPVWPVAGSGQGTPLLSFRDIAQAYYIDLVRKHFHLSLRKTREVLENNQRA